MHSVTNNTATIFTAADELPRLLVIDDDCFFQAQIKLYVVNRYAVTQSLSAMPMDALSLIRADTILLDLNMPGVDGVSFIKTIASLNPKPKLLIASSYDNSIIELARSAAQLYGLTQTVVLQKPISKDQLLQALAELEFRGSNHLPLPCATDNINQADIIKASHAGEFLLFYQPQISLESDDIVGIEALVRWDHPQFGRLTPAFFIHLIEDSADAIEFTLMVAEMAIRDTLRIIKEQGFRGNVSVNIPPIVLMSETFTDRLCDMLSLHGLPPERFQCEITERGLDSPGPQASATLARLRMKGIQLSIDDFGVGQSGLSKIKTGAFDEIKIDRSFISDLTCSLDSQSIVKSIIHLASLVNLRVVAEGIENNPTLMLCKQLGVANAQGFYCARPMPAEEFCSWLCARPDNQQPGSLLSFRTSF